MRRGEALGLRWSDLGLRWSDLDLEAGRVRVVQTIIQVGNIVSISEQRRREAGGRCPLIARRSRFCARTDTG